MARAGHIKAFQEEIRETSESYQSICAIYQTAVDRGAEHLPLFDSKSGKTSQKKILKASANTLILSRLKRKSAPRIPHPLFDPLLNLTSARRTFLRFCGIIAEDEVKSMNQSEMCPRFEKAVDILSKRWVALIVFQLLNGQR